MKLKDVVAKNKKKIYELAERNTVRNDDGLTVIKRNDPSILEDEEPREALDAMEHPFFGKKQLVRA